MIFPKNKWKWILFGLVLFEFATHLEMRSPYLYYTKGLFDYVDNSYGMRLGPRGELLHFDTVNYWFVENLFSGKYRGDKLSTISRPAYAYVASLFDNYFYRLYSGWMLNIGLWFLACLFGYHLVFTLSRSHQSALAFSVLTATSPVFINVAGQPMGYLMGYSLVVIFLSVLFSKSLYQKNPQGYLGALAFLLILCDQTYQILGPICVLVLLLAGWRFLKFKHICAVLFSVLAFRLAWNHLAIGWILSDAPGGVSNPQTGALIEQLSLVDMSLLGKVLSSLVFGFFLATFFIPSAIAVFSFFVMDRPVKELFLILLAAVSTPLFYMGLVGETTGYFLMYREGRLVAYYFPAACLAFCIGFPVFLKKPPFISLVWGKRLFWALILVTVLLANMDIFGYKGLYHLFNFRSAYA